MTHLLGIDLAAGPATTAACVVDWSQHRPRIVTLEPKGVSDARIVGLHRMVDVTGIDAPFGWPRSFAETVGAYAQGVPWPATLPPNLWFRRTDEAARLAAGGRPPLSVSSDRIARPAERAARLLTLLGKDGRALERDGSDNVIEVYPAGALRRWGVDARGYKQPEGASVRETIVAALISQVGLDMAPADRVELVAADHAIDALVSALVARAYSCDQVIEPTDEDRAVARVEGWLYLPSEPLSRLNAASPRPSWAARSHPPSAYPVQITEPEDP